jgi:hypothetical protein
MTLHDELEGISTRCKQVTGASEEERRDKARGRTTEAELGLRSRFQITFYAIVTVLIAIARPS